MHDPPEKLAVALAALVRVLDSVVPFSTYTSVLLATQTVAPLAELDEHELVVFGVVTVVGDPPVPIPELVSIGTTSTPTGPPPQLPRGAYTVALVPWTRIPSELEGTQ